MPVSIGIRVFMTLHLRGSTAKLILTAHAHTYPHSQHLPTPAKGISQTTSLYAFFDAVQQRQKVACIKLGAKDVIERQGYLLSLNVTAAQGE